jgi:hypothetical protein
MFIGESKGALQDRLNLFIYGEPGSGKTHLLLGAPGIVLVDFEEGSLTADGLGMNVPLLRPESWEDILRILEAPELVIEEIHKIERFKDYEVKTWGFDSLTTMQRMLLGHAPRDATDTLPARKGKNIMGVARNRAKELTPSIEDYGILVAMLEQFMNAVRQMEYNTIITCHAEISETEASPKGLNVDPSKVKFAGYPSVIGKLKYRIGGLADFFIRLETVRRGNELKYYAHCIQSEVWRARTKVANFLDAKIEDPTFDKFVEVYQKAIGGIA